MTNIDTSRIELIALAFCLVFMSLLVRLIMKRRLKEEYILVWLGVLVIYLFFVLFRGQLDALSTLMGVHYAPSLLFLILLAAISLYALHLSVVVSDHSHKIKELAQKISLLEEEVKRGKEDNSF